MYILGLTGGMASGKTTVAGFLRDCGAVIVDADQIVHNLQKPGTPETLKIAKKLGCQVLHEDGSLNRQALAAAIQADKTNLQFLEDVLHPAVRREERNQLAFAAQSGAKVAVLDVPLLFETDAHLLSDGVAVCHSPMEVRKQRAFERPGMNDAKWDNLLSRRWPDAKMLEFTDFVVNTHTEMAETREQVQKLYNHIAAEPATAWPAKWVDVA